MKFLNLDRVLCLSAHPDDAEYGMLGSMMKFTKTQFDVAVLSNGGDFDGSTGTNRIKECSDIWGSLSNVSGNFLDNNYIKDRSEDSWINKIEKKYDVNSYDVIFTTPHLDTHFEHRIVNRIAWALIRSSKCGLITYKAPSTMETWKPNYYISINDIINKKIIMLENFKSQKSKSYFQPDSVKAFHTNYMSSKFGINYVEHYNIERVFSL